MKCDKCGAKIEKTADNCAECGAPMGGGTKAKVAKKAGAKKTAHRPATRVSARHGARASTR